MDISKFFKGEGTDLLSNIFSGKAISFIELVALISLFKNKKIPFDLSFTPTDGRDLAQVQFTIYLSPLVQFSITVQLCN